jgi:hypothetical protein
MARRGRATHTLEFTSDWIYPLSDIERRQLPELEISLDYLGWDENKTHHIKGRVKILHAGDLLLQHMPPALKKMRVEQLDIEAANKRTAFKEAVEWADDLIAEFMASGFFSLATLDASGIEKGVFEYEPQLKVTSAKVYKVKG